MKKYIYVGLLCAWSFFINAMHKNGEDLKRIVQGAMEMSARLGLYTNDGFKKKDLKEQLQAERDVAQLAQYYMEKKFDPDTWEHKAKAREEEFQLKNQETFPFLLKCLQEANMRKFQERMAKGQINDLFKPLREELSSDEEFRLDALLYKKRCELFYENGNGIITLQEINNCLNG